MTHDALIDQLYEAKSSFLEMACRFDDRTRPELAQGMGQGLAIASIELGRILGLVEVDLRDRKRVSR